MQQLADQNSDFMSYHEGLLGGVNARGQEMSADNYEGWYYGHASPWIKMTGGGEDLEEFLEVIVTTLLVIAEITKIYRCNVSRNTAREWMSYEVLFFLETVAYYYGMAGIDNDGDGLIDEDGWDGIDNDGDCLRLNSSYQDSMEMEYLVGLVIWE